jgi:hypothetical protein
MKRSREKPHQKKKMHSGKRGKGDERRGWKEREKERERETLRGGSCTRMLTDIYARTRCELVVSVCLVVWECEHGRYAYARSGLRVWVGGMRMVEVVWECGHGCLALSHVNWSQYCHRGPPPQGSLSLSLISSPSHARVTEPCHCSMSVISDD